MKLTKTILLSALSAFAFLATSCDKAKETVEKAGDTVKEGAAAAGDKMKELRSLSLAGFFLQGLTLALL